VRREGGREGGEEGGGVLSSFPFFHRDTHAPSLPPSLRPSPLSLAVLTKGCTPPCVSSWRGTVPEWKVWREGGREGGEMGNN
jgi:hypothetical protein